MTIIFHEFQLCFSKALHCGDHTVVSVNKYLLDIEMQHEISNNVVCATSKGSDQPAHMRSLIRAFASHLIKLLTEHYLEFQCFKGGCTESSESIHVKMQNCWKSHVTALSVAFTPSLRENRWEGGTRWSLPCSLSMLNQAIHVGGGSSYK